MRVLRDAKGNYTVDDEPMRLTGESAKQFLAEMREREAAPRDERRERFLADCRDTYENFRQKSAS